MNPVGNALQITNATAILKYREVETNGNANINCHVGSIRLMYKPNWSDQNYPGGTGPGNWVQLVEMGRYTTDASAGWFSLSIDPTGTNIWFSSQDNAAHSQSNVFFASASTGYFHLASNEWKCLTLDYWDAGCRLRVDTMDINTFVTGTRPVPPAAVRAQGFTIGSATNGTGQVKGLIDEFETMDYTLPTVDKLYQPENVLSATVTPSPPAIRLEWRNQPNQTGVLQRKLPTDTSWTSIITNVSWGYTDTNVVVNQRYEYQLSVTPTLAGPRYLMSGINLAPVETRGKIILLVDQTLSRALTNELNQLTRDLTGDGWTVISTNVPRHIDDYSSSTSFWTNASNITNKIKPFIVSTYNADPTNTRAVFIVGHVSIPYSGYAYEDGHNPQHAGAWSADIYYGDVDGIWTDTSTTTTNPQYPETINTAGDGKFDQDKVPTNSLGVAKLELAVGRIDFARMNVFYSNGQDEASLLRQYLVKNHRYHNREPVFAKRAIVTSTFGNPFPDNEGIYKNALLNGSSMFSFEPGKILEGDIFSDKQSCVLGVHGGLGGGDAISAGAYTSGYFTSTNLANEPPVAFYLLDGSFFGDWNLQSDNFLRATLGTPTYGLGAMWFRFAQWRLERFAIGDTLGDCLVRTANDTNQFPGGGLRWLAIMGDPTLRMTMSAPPSNLIATPGGGNVVLTWTISPEANASYFVYRSTNNLAGPFVRLTSNPIIAGNYTDSSPPTGPKVYQVRALNTVTTGCGSFTNMSTGVFVNSN